MNEELDIVGLPNKHGNIGLSMIRRLRSYLHSMHRLMLRIIRA